MIAVQVIHIQDQSFYVVCGQVIPLINTKYPAVWPDFCCFVNVAQYYETIEFVKLKFPILSCECQTVVPARNTALIVSIDFVGTDIV